LTIVALGILIAIWGVFLGVMWVRRRAEFRADSSIGTFHRQLQVLRRNSEALYGAAPGDSAYVAEDERQALHSGRHSQGVPTQESPRPYGSAQPGFSPGRGRQDPYFRREARERRRDVMFILVAAFLCTGLIGIIPAARVSLFVMTALAVVLAVYVVLLVRLRAQALEREMKLRYMPKPDAQPVFDDRRVVAR
jgi:hypothetical protein